MPDADSIASSGAVALVLALAIIGGFVSGAIVSGKVVDRVVSAVDKLTDAFERMAPLLEDAIRELRRTRG